MHTVIINGSPRIRKYSNTDKIIESFGKGLSSQGCTYELYSISCRNEWDAAREAFSKADNIIIALPLFVECLPGLFLEFLSTLPKKRKNPAQLSFILQGGFAEGCQLRCGEKFLMSLPEKLGCTYGGTLIKGDNFGIRVFEGEDRDRILTPYIAMGEVFAKKGSFKSEEAKKFTGAEVFPLPIRLLISTVFVLKAKKMYTEISQKVFDCKEDLKSKPYES